MGWITFNKPKHISPSDYFRNEFTKGLEKYELLDVAIVNRTECYMAVKNKETGKIFAAVYILTYGRGYYNFGYKSMDEFMGPGASKCPKRILDILSPLTDEDDPNGYARNWRKNCNDYIEQRKKNNKLKAGDIIKTENPIHFNNGVTYEFFMVTEKKNRFFAMFKGKEGELYKSSTVRFTLSNFGYEKIEGQN